VDSHFPPPLPVWPRKFLLTTQSLYSFWQSFHSYSLLLSFYRATYIVVFGLLTHHPASLTISSYSIMASHRHSDKFPSGRITTSLERSVQTCYAATRALRSATSRWSRGVLTGTRLQTPVGPLLFLIPGADKMREWIYNYPMTCRTSWRWSLLQTYVEHSFFTSLEQWLLFGTDTNMIVSGWRSQGRVARTMMWTWCPPVVSLSSLLKTLPKLS